jgi:hypothetical protein
MTNDITSTHRADCIAILRDERAVIRLAVEPAYNPFGVLLTHGRYEVVCPLRSSRSGAPVVHAHGRTPDEAVEELRASWEDELRHAPFVFGDEVYGVPV